MEMLQRTRLAVSCWYPYSPPPRVCCLGIRCIEYTRKLDTGGVTRSSTVFRARLVELAAAVAFVQT